MYICSKYLALEQVERVSAIFKRKWRLRSVVWMNETDRARESSVSMNLFFYCKFIKWWVRIMRCFTNWRTKGVRMLFAIDGISMGIYNLYKMVIEQLADNGNKRNNWVRNSLTMFDETTL